METILIRADASREIGTGHLMRCLALAQGFSEKPTFAIAVESPLEERLTEGGMRTVRIDAERGSGADADETIRLGKSIGGKWIVVDGYDFDAAYQRRIRNAGFRLFLIDDHAHLDRYDCDVLLNQNIDADPSMYAGKADATFLLGPTFTLLREEFRSDVVDKVIPETATNLLISFGGTDVASVESLVRGAIARIPDLSFDVEVLRNVTDVPGRMRWADLAVTAAGSTLWELLHLGTPFIVGVVAENQAGNARVLGERGLAIDCGWFRDCSEDMLAQHLEKLANDRDLRERFSKTGKRTVDGRGVERVVTVLQ